MPAGKDKNKKTKKSPQLFTGILSLREDAGKLYTRDGKRLSTNKSKSTINKVYFKIKLYQKLRAKGIKPVIKYPGKKHICKNCKVTFTGSFCYNCGQSAKVNRLNFKSFIENLLGGITNVSNGFPFTFINLFSRPGYMLNDYIRGRRIIYAKPFQLLFVTAAIFALLNQIMHPKSNLDEFEETVENVIQETDSLKTGNTYTLTQPIEKDKLAITSNEPTKSADSNALDSKLSSSLIITEKLEKIAGKTQKRIEEKTKKIKQQKKEWQAIENDPAGESLDENEEELKEVSNVIKGINSQFKQNHPIMASIFELLKGWFSSNKAVLEIIIIPFIALAAKWSFRKSKYNSHFNFIEMVYITTFVSCQIMLISLLALCLNIETSNVPWTRLVFSYWVFKELFRNSYWKTLWKTIQTFLIALILLLIFISIIVALVISLIFIYYFNRNL